VGKLLSMEQCPKCAAEGRDTKGDNLAVYSDGRYCFCCGYYKGGTEGMVPTERLENGKVVHKYVHLPKPEFNSDAVKWVTKYLSIEQMDKHEVYSAACGMVFPFRDQNGKVTFFQVRNFPRRLDGPKWYSQGVKPAPYVIKNPLEAFDNKEKKGLLIVEDIVSGIMAVDEPPFYDVWVLFGSIIPLRELLYLVNSQHYTNILIHLDYDKRDYVQNFVNRARPLTKCTMSFISTREDPKDWFRLGKIVEQRNKRNGV